MFCKFPGPTPAKVAVTGIADTDRPGTFFSFKRSLRFFSSFVCCALCSSQCQRVTSGLPHIIQRPSSFIFSCQRCCLFIIFVYSVQLKNLYYIHPDMMFPPTSEVDTVEQVAQGNMFFYSNTLQYIRLSIRHRMNPKQTGQPKQRQRQV